MEDYLFLDKSNEPTELDLKEVLSDTYNLWTDIKLTISSQYGSTISEWKFYTKKTGWTLKTLLGKRNLFFFKPYNKYFTLTFVFGDKAVNAVEDSDVSENLKQTLREAKKYAEGRGISVEVKNKKNVKDVLKLLDIKINN